MEYIYAALTIHKAGGKIDEQTVTKVLQAAGVNVDEARVKALVAALDGVDIDEAMSKAVAAPVAVAAPAQAAEQSAAPAEEKASEEEDKKSEEEAAAGLGALFG